MSISGRDLNRVARELADVKPLPELGAFAYGTWVKSVGAVADSFHDLMGLDINGNRRFQRERFEVACGFPPESERKL